jgi:gas vesicle protein
MSDNTRQNELQANHARSQNTESLVLGILVGAFLGGGIALLFAPMKGSDTRKAIKEGEQITEETIRETLKTLKEQVAILSAGVRGIVAEVENFGKNE